MEWLRKILESAELTEDGNIDIEAVMRSVDTEFPKYAVPKADFNGKVGELKVANDTIVELKKANGDNEGLQKKIGEYEKEIIDLKKSAEDTSKTYALKEQLSKQGVLDPDYIIYKTGGIEKFIFDKEGKPIGVEEVLKSYKEDDAMSHLFKKEKRNPYDPPAGGVGGNVNPFAKETFNMTKQGELFKNNPEQARALAAAAGITI